MGTRSFRLLNVFTVGDDRFTGNPLCVFEDGQGLSDSEMQAIALQFNLSETTFLFPASTADASRRVRIFSKTFEMPFAGHPTLGTANVVRDLFGSGDRVTLEMKVGLVNVAASKNEWTLKTARAPEVRIPEASRTEIAAALGTEESAISGSPLWVDTGSEQLVIPLRSVEDVAALKPDARLLQRHGFSQKRDGSMAYAWAVGSDARIVARFFFLSHGSLVEDAATGSACANLGGWMVATKRSLPVTLEIRQGDHVGRPSRLGLHVDANQSVFVSGTVLEVGRGSFSVD